MQQNHFTLFQFYSYHYSIRLESKEELHFLRLSRWKTPSWSEKYTMQAVVFTWPYSWGCFWLLLVMLSTRIQSHLQLHLQSLILYAKVHWLHLLVRAEEPCFWQTKPRKQLMKCLHIRNCQPSCTDEDSKQAHCTYGQAGCVIRPL